jgi:hypothetical protein
MPLKTVYPYHNFSLFRLNRRGRVWEGVQLCAGREQSAGAVHGGDAHLREGGRAHQLPRPPPRPPLPQQGHRRLEQPAPAPRRPQVGLDNILGRWVAKSWRWVAK